MAKQETMFDEKIDWQARLSARNSAKFDILYPAQEAALDRYSAEFLQEPSIAVELPTGAGKTLIALMILDFWLAQGRKAAVLCGTKNLARQFKEEADSLGIPTILFEGSKTTFSTAEKFQYTRARAVAVLNYWGYINQSPGIEPADILVMDDAHLAENAAHSLFSIEVTRFDHSALYETLLQTLADRFPHYARLAEYASGTSAPVGIIELINFTDWCDATADISAIFDKSDECRSGGSLHWPWKRIKPALLGALCLIGPNNVSIRPGAFPLDKLRHMQVPRQRIMLSATIGLPDDLSRRIGVSNIKSVPIESRYRLAVPGKRLLVFPDTEAQEAEMEILATDAAIKLKRSVWLCSSSNEATTWSKKLQDVLTARDIGDQPIFVAKARAEEIDQFVDAPFGHLFTAARYDGMDFEGDKCRLVVMPSLPTACGLLERFISENLADAAFMSFRVLQRMKQALGRATRSDHDYAAYIFLKSSFSSYLTASESFDEFPTNVQNEIEFGVEVSQKPLVEIVRIFSGFLRGTLTEIGFPQQPAHYPEEILAEETGLANIELDFWDKLFQTGSYDQAAADAEIVATALATNNQPGYALFWRYLKAQAAYLRTHVDNDAAGIGQAKGEIAKILDEPRQSYWFSRLSRLRQTLHMESAPDDTASEEFDCITRGWNTLLDGELRNPAKHQFFFDAIREGIASEDHGKFCHAMRQTMRLIGWEAELREKGNGETDILATVSVSLRQFLLIIEAKPEMSAEKPFPLRYVNQATGQTVRYKADPRFRHHHVRTIVVSKASSLEESAQLAAGTLTFVPQSAVASVASMAIAAFQRYTAIRSRRGLLPKRSECLEPLEMAPRLLGLYDAADESGKLLTDEGVIGIASR